MMVSVTRADNGFREILDLSNATCSLIPESCHDPLHRTGTPRSGVNLKSYSSEVK